MIRSNGTSVIYGDELSLCNREVRCQVGPASAGDWSTNCWEYASHFAQQVVANRTVCNIWTADSDWDIGVQSSRSEWCITRYRCADRNASFPSRSRDAQRDHMYRLSWTAFLGKRSALRDRLKHHWGKATRSHKWSDRKLPAVFDTSRLSLMSLGKLWLHWLSFPWHAFTTLFRSVASSTSWEL